MSKKTIEQILSDSMPELIEASCAASLGLVTSGDHDQMRTGLGAVTKMMPFVIAQQSKQVVELSGGVDSDAFDAVNALIAKKKAEKNG